MANHYEQFSEEIVDLPVESIDWIRKILELDTSSDEDLDTLNKELNTTFEPHDVDPWPGFEWKVEEDSLWVYASEGLDIDHLVAFVRALLKKFIPDHIFSASFASYCSKPRTGEFGGRWLIVTKNGYFGGSTWDSIEDKLKEIGEDATILEQWLEAFDQGQLDDLVHDAKSSEAANINNAGIDGQLEYIRETHGLSWMKRTYEEYKQSVEEAK